MCLVDKRNERVAGEHEEQKKSKFLKVIQEFISHLYTELVERERKNWEQGMTPCTLEPSTLYLSWINYLNRFFPKLGSI